MPLCGHNKHLARSVRAPWRPGHAQNRQGSRYTPIHPETSQANTSHWAGPRPIPNEMPNRNRDMSRDPSRVLILPRACARRVKHNAHPRTSVHVPWCSNAPQNRQGSRGHPEFFKRKTTRPGTLKRPRTCPRCNTIRTRVARSRPHRVQTRPKTVRIPRHTPKHPETPQNAPKLAARRMETGLVEVGALVSFRVLPFMAPPKFSPRGEGAPRRQESSPIPARLTALNAQLNSDLFSTFNLLSRRIK